ncbi:MAG: hypothetical protein JWN27_2663, partial [Candidatus Eremiobacteraeota bacterium]|nr:hypothetical protein [Candidatus Eremiobacteraeota bacterium]
MTLLVIFRAIADYATYPPSIVTLEPVMKPASG